MSLKTDRVQYINIFRHVKSHLRKKSGTSQVEIFVPCTTKECNNITTPYNPFSALLRINTVVAYRRIETIKFQTFSSKSGQGRLQDVLAVKKVQIKRFE